MTTMSKLSRRTFVNQTSATLGGLTVASTLKPQRILGAWVARGGQG